MTNVFFDPTDPIYDFGDFLCRVYLLDGTAADNWFDQPGYVRSVFDEDVSAMLDPNDEALVEKTIAAALKGGATTFDLDLPPFRRSQPLKLHVRRFGNDVTAFSLAQPDGESVIGFTSQTFNNDAGGERERAALAYAASLLAKRFGDETGEQALAIEPFGALGFTYFDAASRGPSMRVELLVVARSLTRPSMTIAEAGCENSR